jgi:hypothetical protein
LVIVHKPTGGIAVFLMKVKRKPSRGHGRRVGIPCLFPTAHILFFYVSSAHDELFMGLALCANISETVLVLLINEQGEKEKG